MNSKEALDVLKKLMNEKGLSFPDEDTPFMERFCAAISKASDEFMADLDVEAEKLPLSSTEQSRMFYRATAIQFATTSLAWSLGTMASALTVASVLYKHGQHVKEEKFIKTAYVMQALMCAPAERSLQIGVDIFTKQLDKRDVKLDAYYEERTKELAHSGLDMAKDILKTRKKP